MDSRKGLYIFLTPALGGMGGSQMYVKNRCDYLKSQNWDVLVLHYQNMPLMITKGEIPHKNLDFLTVLPQFCSWQNKLKGLKVIKNEIKENYKNIIIESHTFGLLFWGEYFAKKLHARHIANPLDEEVYPDKKSIQDFFKFKLFRNEWMNASEKSLKRFFRSAYNPQYSEYFFEMRAICSNVVDEDNTNFKDIEKGDYNILSIGRLDKKYIIPLCNEITKFSKQHQDKVIYVNFIGDAIDKSIIINIKNILNLKNIKAIFWGYMYPVNKNIIISNEVAVASSNSVLVSSRYGVPTIVVDGHDLKAIGIYGCSTNNTLFRDKDSEPKLEISRLLEDVLVHHSYKTNISNIRNENLTEIMKSHTNFACNAKKEMAYYPINKIYGINGVIRRIYHSIKK